MSERPGNALSLLPDTSVHATDFFKDDLSQYRWFRAMIILLYGLSLEMAAQVLFVFPYSRVTSDPSKADFRDLAIAFLVYTALDVGFMCTFCGVCVFFLRLDMVSEAITKNDRQGLLRRKWAQLVLCTVSEAMFLAGSAVFGYYLFDDYSDSNALYSWW